MLLALLPIAGAALPDDVLTALRRGDCGETLALVGAVDDIEEAMALATCGHPQHLVAYLDGSELDPYARVLVARGTVDDSPKFVAETLSGVDLPGAAGDDAAMLYGRALVGSGRSLEARPHLRALLSTDRKGEALYWLAVGAEDRGDEAAALDAHRSNWANNVKSPFSLQSAERLDSMGHPVDDLGTLEAQQLALNRARNLVKVYRAPEAIPLYDALSAVNSRSDASWTHELAMALFKAKDYPRSMAVMAELKPTEPGTKGGAQTLFDYALGTSRTGDYATAAVYYSRLLELYPSHELADTASYKLGYLAYDEGRLDEAILLFEAHLKRKPSTRHADESYWFLGWASLRSGDLEAAERWLDRLVSGHGSSSLAPQALYWKARIRGMQGDVSGETAALKRLISSYPVSGHAWYAADRLGRSFPGIGEVEVPPLDETFVSSNDDVRLGLALYKAGQFAWARERLVAAIPAARAKGKSTALSYAHLLVEVGAYKDAQALARPWCAKPWRAGDAPLATTACYPRPEKLVVETAAAEYGLFPLLPFAIMTAESALDPSVTSLAGARGLMQLMPELAGELHDKRLPEDPYDPDRLYVAGYNAWLGTTELGELYTRFHGAGVEPRMPLAIAGYNGGSEAVERWLSEYEEPPEIDWFAENISYSETRRYTKRVLGYVMTYRWIYGDPE